MKMNKTKYIRHCFSGVAMLAVLVLIWAIFFVPYMHLFQADQILTAVPEIREPDVARSVREALTTGRFHRMTVVASLGTALLALAIIGRKLTRSLEMSEQHGGRISSEGAPSAPPNKSSP